MLQTLLGRASALRTRTCRVVSRSLAHPRTLRKTSKELWPDMRWCRMKTRIRMFSTPICFSRLSSFWLDPRLDAVVVAFGYVYGCTDDLLLLSICSLFRTSSARGDPVSDDAELGLGDASLLLDVAQHQVYVFLTADRSVK